MRPLRILIFAVAVLTLALATTVMGTPSTVSYQGRLTSSSGTSVADGHYTITFSLWTDSTAGSMVWTEVQDVTVAGGGGLFSCYLGRLQPLGGAILTHSSDNLYLQTSLAGTPLLPRVAIAAVPNAISSSAVQSSVPGVGSLKMSVGTDTTKISSSRTSASGLIESSVNLLDDRGLLGLRAYSPGTTEQSVWQKVDNSEARCAVGVDNNGDGNPDVGSSSSALLPRAVLKTFFQRGDMPTQSSIVDSVDETGAYHGTIRYNGTDFEGHRVYMTPDSAFVSTEASNSSASSSNNMRVRINDLESKLQSAGLLGASSVTQTLTPTTCGVAINTKGTGADKGRTISATCNDTSATHSVEVDQNGNGNAEARGQIQARHGEYIGASTTLSFDTNDDGTADITAGGAVDDSSAQWGVSGPAQVGGGNGWSVYSSAKESRDILKEKFLDGEIPSQDRVVNASGSTITITDTKGTGGMATTRMHAGDSASIVTENDPNGNGRADSRANIAAVLNGNVVIGAMRDVNDDGNPDVTAETIVTSDSATIRLNDMAPGIPVASTIAMTASSIGVHMEVGAATCDGTNWTNASDANLKENFHPVDGAKLLEAIERLPVSEWNYRTQSDTLKHIGPTAQDFKRTFGVGSDGKSISTIDPSGIALAAIKELNKQNRQLHEQNAKLQTQNAELKRQMDDLAKKVEKLATKR